MDCGERHVPGQGCHKYGKQWKCAKCHSAQRWLRDNDPDWSNKTSLERKELILANRDHGGRGAARKLHTCHKARTYSTSKKILHNMFLSVFCSPQDFLTWN